jgi:hypothetical protein
MFPAEQSGQLGQIPWASIPLQQLKGWQASYLTWEYEYTQENLELMILLQCDDTFPVFIDNVTVNYAT